MSEIIITPFAKVYDAFFSKITDDMYMELTENDTYSMLEALLLAAICQFEFPRVNLNDYTLGRYEPSENQEYNAYNAENDPRENRGYFRCELSQEEINILATYMVVEWLGQQLASIENIRMKYSGSDFKFTSQANHIAKVLALKQAYEKTGFHLQRLYKRRKADSNGILRPTMKDLMSGSK